VSHRIEQVGNLIRDEISVLLRREVKDPRLSSMVSINEVCVSPDFRYAKVYVSSLGPDALKKDTISGLAAASGFLRNQLAKNLRLRRVPELIFEWDESMEHGARVLQLIDEVCPPQPTEPSN
jgi:ribosome-binding factor A